MLDHLFNYLEEQDCLHLTVCVKPETRSYAVNMRIIQHVYSIPNYEIEKKSFSINYSVNFHEVNSFLL